MKKSLLALLATAAVSQAAPVEFDLSPPITDRGPGLNPATKVPAVTNSSGSGDEISGGITFNPTNRTLSFAVGYGSAAGFTNLTSNERVNGTGDGNTATDWEIIGDHGLRLRAERSGNGAGRIYTVAVQAEDAAKNTSVVSLINVGVAKSQGK